MIEIKIDLVPFGFRDHTRQIGYIKIWNDATGTYEIGNYGYKIEDEDGNLVQSGEYKGFKRGKGVFLLLKEILDHAHGGV